MEVLQNSFNLWVDLHVDALEAEVGQILGGAETAGKHEPGKISRNELFEGFDGRARDSGRLVQDVPLLFHRFTVLVVDHVSLKKK